MVSIITNILAWFIKNSNVIIGVIKELVKLIAGLINILQPSKDDLVDKVEKIGEKIQKTLFQWSEVLKNFGR